jgi:hypothetical protein
MLEATAAPSPAASRKWRREEAFFCSGVSFVGAPGDSGHLTIFARK